MKQRGVNTMADILKIERQVSAAISVLSGGLSAILITSFVDNDASSACLAFGILSGFVSVLFSATTGGLMAKSH